MPAAARLRQAAPLLLLLLALSTLFIFDGVWQESFRLRIPAQTHSWKALQLAENLSPEHNFRLFIAQYPSRDGRPDYEPYSRFPVGGTALIKLVMLPFGDDWPAKAAAARLLMLAVFSAAALLAWQSLRRITGNPWVALAATLLAFSSEHLLRYSGIISPEMSLNIFGVLLAFHGMVVFEQEGRFRQLLAKSGAGLLLDWHVYALLLPFVVFGLARALFQTIKPALTRAAQVRPDHLRIRLPSTLPQPRRRFRELREFMGAGKLGRGARGLLGNRYLQLGITTLLFGLAALSFNFYNEYTALKGEVSFTELPSVRSMLFRTNLDTAARGFPDANQGWEFWREFGEQQVLRIGIMSLSRAYPNYGDRGLEPDYPSAVWAATLAAGILAAGGALAGLLFSRYRLLLGALALAGGCWALAVRDNVANHSLESMIYLGIPLTFFSLLLVYVARRWGPRPGIAIGVATAAIFALGVFELRPGETNAGAHAFNAAVTQDFAAIRPLTRGQSLFLDWPQSVKGKEEEFIYFHLSGSHISNRAFRYPVTPRRPLETADLDFVVSPQHHPEITLTPGNRLAFLYHADDWLNTYRPVISGPPAAASFFDVHRHGNELLYSKSPCTPAEVQDEWFFLHLYPAEVGDLPEHHQPHGFGNHDFRFERRGAIIGGVCFARIELPEYEISSIRTGQYTPGQGRSWEVEFPVSDAAGPGAGTP